MMIGLAVCLTEKIRERERERWESADTWKEGGGGRDRKSLSFCSPSIDEFHSHHSIAAD